MPGSRPSGADGRRSASSSRRGRVEEQPDEEKKPKKRPIPDPVFTNTTLAVMDGSLRIEAVPYKELPRLMQELVVYRDWKISKRLIDDADVASTRLFLARQHYNAERKIVAYGKKVDLLERCIDDAERNLGELRQVTADASRAMLGQHYDARLRMVAEITRAYDAAANDCLARAQRAKPSQRLRGLREAADVLEEKGRYLESDRALELATIREEEERADREWALRGDFERAVGGVRIRAEQALSALIYGQDVKRARQEAVDAAGLSAQEQLVANRRWRLQALRARSPVKARSRSPGVEDSKLPERSPSRIQRPGSQAQRPVPPAQPLELPALDPASGAAKVLLQRAAAAYEVLGDAG